MNRAALAARMFLVVALLPAFGAAGYAAYAYRHQPPIPPGTFRQFSSDPKISGKPSPGLLFGTYNLGKGTANLAAFDQEVGHRAVLTVRYIYWGKTFPAKYVASAAALGAETVVELEPRGPKAPTLAQIAAGQQDSWLRKFAQEAVGPQDHFILSFAPEMNGKWYQYGAKFVTGGQYIAAYRHVYDVLVATHAAPLITFLWQPSAMHRTTPSPMPYWPGSRYVNEIGLDGYYFYADDDFRRIFGKTLKLIRQVAPNKPMLIGETAAGPEFGKESADIRDLFAGIARNHLLGFIWFDRNQLHKKYPAKVRQFHQDWYLQDFPAAMTSFQDALVAAGPLASYPLPRKQQPHS
jgi:mannan endo-1,4-beta-mannosidase